ncbi:MAG: YIP1 family protein [Rubrobacter sp.]|nr:YIP1 family protein [Rubrobacter sp.]
MDFDTGRRPEDSQGAPRSSRTGSGGGFGGAPPRATSGVSGGDFDYRNLVPSFVETARGVVTQPVGFFRSLPRQGDLVSPLAFALICVEITVLIAGFVGVIVNVVSGTQGILGSLGSFVLLLVLIPLIAAVSLFISAGIYHLLVALIIKPAQSGFAATLRVIAYPTVVFLAVIVTTIIALIPFIGPILSLLLSLVTGLFSLYLYVIGMREMHATSTGRAVVVVIIPPIVGGILGLIFGVILAAIIASMLN